MSVEKVPILEEGDSTLSTSSRDGEVLDPDVIGHICKFLSTEDIKNCRLVSSSWEEGATPVLKARTRTTLDLTPRHDENGDVKEDWDVSDVVKKLDFCPVNIRLAIAYDGRHEDNLPALDVSPMNNFKSIIVQLPLGDQFHWEREICTKLILSASTTLEELKFYWQEDMGSWALLDFPPLGGTLFPKLMTLNVNQFFEWGMNAGVKEMGQAITTSFQNLTYLSTKGDYLVAMSVRGILSRLPQSLSCLELDGYFEASTLKCLLEISVTLKKLIFGASDSIELNIDARADEFPTIFYELLKKHAPTLEELEIRVDWGDKEKILAWKLPVFPVLRKLLIDYCEIVATFVFETDLDSGHFGPINYAVCFPVLEDLQIISRMDASGVESFLPANNNLQVVKSVRQVSLGVVLNDDFEVLVIDQARIDVRLLDLFPNARDCVMADLRQVLGTS